MTDQFSPIDGLRSQAVPVISLSCRSNFFTLRRPTRTCSPKNAQREYAIVAGPWNGCLKAWWNKCTWEIWWKVYSSPVRKLTLIELTYNMVARFTKLPAAIPWTKKSSTFMKCGNMELQKKSIKERKRFHDSRDVPLDQIPSFRFAGAHINFVLTFTSRFSAG